MSQTVSSYLLERLQAWGVEQVFAYPGDGINGILAAWGRAELIRSSSRRATRRWRRSRRSGYAKFSGKVGVCMATSGPGAIHLLNGLYDAKLDHVPVVAIVGQTDRTAHGRLLSAGSRPGQLFKDVCHQYVQTLTVPQQLPNLIDRAIRIALANALPTCIIVPSDVQELDYEPPGHAFKMVPSSLGIAWPRPAPTTRASAGRRRSSMPGSKVAILVGQGARGRPAGDQQVADVWGPGWPRPCWAKMCSPTSCLGDRLDRPARDPAAAMS